MANNRTHSHPLSPLNASIQALQVYITNIAFRIQQFTPLSLPSTKPNLKEEESFPKGFYMSGREVASFGEFKRQVQALIWFTYRKNVRITPQIYTDNGWGCLLRVAQMALAKAYQRHSQLQGGLGRNQIIGAFVEDQEAQYSIMKVVRAGYELWNKRGGEWYSMTQAAITMEALHQQNTLVSSSTLSIKVYHRTIDYEELTQLFTQSKYNQEQLTQSTENNDEGLKRIPQTPSRSTITNKERKAIFLMLTTNFSDQSRKGEERHLLNLMELPIFSSCMGGVPDKARFIIGKSGESLYYLDPHYVQQAVSKNTLLPNIHTFTSPNLRSMKCTDLDRDITLCFYLRNQSDLEMLTHAIDRAEERTPNSLISYDSVAKREKAQMEEAEWIEPDFQVLDFPRNSSQEFECLRFEELTS